MKVHSQIDNVKLELKPNSTTKDGLTSVCPSIAKPNVGSSAGKFDVDGREILVGDILEATFFNDEQYTTHLKVVIDKEDNDDICLLMIKGNEKAMKGRTDKDLQAFPNEKENGWLSKGRIINR